jgi:hemolysin III
VAGVVLKTAYMDVVAEWVGLTLYLTLGWLGVVGGVVLWRRHGFGFISPMLWGGVAYSVGAGMDFAKSPVVWPGVVHAHEVFHLAVLVGAGFHFAFIWRVARGEGSPGRGSPGKALDDGPEVDDVDGAAD